MEKQETKWNPLNATVCNPVVVQAVQALRADAARTGFCLPGDMWACMRTIRKIQNEKAAS
jgi:hypothetical protein